MIWGRRERDSLDLVDEVAFQGVWKSSLTELSGGQKSLLALSLVLALLKYKPAPMYILDEIDAALDLSHTQNIGTMIKQHFPEAQFIVVSLKDGMFQVIAQLVGQLFLQDEIIIIQILNFRNIIETRIFCIFPSCCVFLNELQCLYLAKCDTVMTL